MRVLGLIPARGGSKGVLRKNARVLAGRPLIAWTAEAALSSASLDRVILSTEDDEIAALGCSAGLEVPFRRPSSLASDSSPMIDVVLHALAWAQAEGEAFDAVCLLQPTSPLRTSHDIDGVIRLLAETEADTVFSTLDIPREHHPDWAFVEGEDGGLHIATGGHEPVARRQDLRPAYHREGSVYAALTRVVLTRRSLYGDRIRPYPIEPERSINIDTPEDWDRAEAILSRSWH